MKHRLFSVCAVAGILLAPLSSQAQPETIASPEWRHLSSKTGDLPVPGESHQQTACVVFDADKDGVNDFVLGFRQKAPALVWYRHSVRGWDRYVIETNYLTIEAGGAVYDIDGDGDPDLVLGGDWQSDEVWWWENPYPRFNPNIPWKRHLIKKGGATQHHDQVFGDFKGTGHPQLAFWNQSAKTLFLADIPPNPRGSGTWPLTAIFTNAPSGGSPYIEGIAAADVDGDGQVDLLAGNYWFKYLGGGRFKAIQIARQGGRIAAGQLVEGGFPEVVISPGDGVGSLKWYECKGDPQDSRSWISHELLNQEVIHGHSLQLADLNGDGHLDIFCAEMAKWHEDQNEPDNPDARAWIFFGDGQGHFRTTAFSTGIGFHEARVADLNGDGLPDILDKPYNWDTPRVDLWLQIGPAGGDVSSGATAVSVREFLDSIGVCTHIGQGIDNPSQSAAALAYAGIRNIRDDRSARHVPDWISISKQTGVKVLLTQSGPDEAAMAGLLNQSRQLAETGALLALEGPNEPNNWAVTFDGQKSDHDSSFLPVARWQREFYSRAKNDPVLADYPVFHSSEAGGAEPDNVGLQFLTIPSGAGTLMPDGTTYADFANVHNYICRQPHIIDNMAWVNADPVFQGWTDGLFAEYGKTWNKGFSGYSDDELKELPRVTTETGWATGTNGLTQEQQGRLYLNLYLAQFKQGFTYTFVYMLRDAGGSDAGYGIFDTNYVPKTAATYLHNLTTILSDPGTDHPGKLRYRIEHAPETLHDLLLQKSNGKFDLVIWNESVQGSDRINLRLERRPRVVEVYDPTTGTTPIHAIAGTRSFPLVLTDHPLVIEIAP